jgi:hypothetical protein
MNASKGKRGVSTVCCHHGVCLDLLIVQQASGIASVIIFIPTWESENEERVTVEVCSVVWVEANSPPCEAPLAILDLVHDREKGQEAQALDDGCRSEVWDVGRAGRSQAEGNKLLTSP